MKQKLIALLSKITFAIGCLVVAIYTRLRDVFLPKKEVLPMAHDCSFLYPNDQEVMDAASNLVHMAVTPADRDVACVAHCGWVVLGYGLSKGLPHPPVMFGTETTPTLETCYEELAKELHPCLPTHGATPEGMQAININWGKVIQLVKFLLDLLGS